jgi:predicted RNA-binding Zn-ribbon protein involved in translation (DUF1610 family)
MITEKLADAIVKRRKEEAFKLLDLDPDYLLFSKEQCGESLKEELEREPTEEEVKSFWEWLTLDAGQWLNDNMKSWLVNLEYIERKCPVCNLELEGTLTFINDHIERCKKVSSTETTYECPDCGWTITTRQRRVRCGNCKSLNLERKLPDGRLIKADADENDPQNATAR